MRKSKKFVDDQVNSFTIVNNSKDFQDMKGRRIINLGDSKASQDAVTRSEMIAQLNEIRAFVGMPLLEG